MGKSGEAREKHRLACRQYYARHKDAALEQARQHYAGNRERIRAAQRTYKYGITPEEFDGAREAQGDVCATCRRPFDGTPYVDHDHTTRRIRGLLCNRCNLMLGHSRDNPATLARAARYLSGAF